MGEGDPRRQHQARAVAGTGKRDHRCPASRLAHSPSKTGVNALMSRKSGNRFSDKDMRKLKESRDARQRDSRKSPSARILGRSRPKNAEISVALSKGPSPGRLSHCLIPWGGETVRHPDAQYLCRGHLQGLSGDRRSLADRTQLELWQNESRLEKSAERTQLEKSAERTQLEKSAERTQLEKSAEQSQKL